MHRGTPAVKQPRRGGNPCPGSAGRRRGHDHVRSDAGRRDRYRERPGVAARLTQVVPVTGTQELQGHVHDRALRQARQQALLGRHAQGQGRQQARDQGERPHAGDRGQRERCRPRQPGAAADAAAAARQRLLDPDPRPRADQPQPARSRRSARTRSTCGSTPSRAPATCSATCCAGSPGSSTRTRSPTHRSASSRRS